MVCEDLVFNPFPRWIQTRSKNPCVSYGQSLPARLNDTSNVKDTNYKILKPDTGLQKYVDYFWAGEIYLDQTKQQTFEHLAPASTTLDLIFFDEGHFNDNEAKQKLSQNGIIYGQKTSFDHYNTTSQKATLFGIKLKPSILLATLNIPASEITEQQIDLRTLFGYSGEKLTEFILSTHTLEEKATAFSMFLKEQQKEIKPKFQTLENFIEKVDYSSDYLTINKRVKHNFLSKRQFERDFKSLTGFSFRKFFKLKRFEKFFRTVQSNQLNSNLTQSAYQFGYYDQAHLNRDFKEFTGLCPKKFVRDFCTDVR